MKLTRAEAMAKQSEILAQRRFYVKMGEAVKDLPDNDGEQRFNENHDDRGRFTFGKSG